MLYIDLFECPKVFRKERVGFLGFEVIIRAATVIFFNLLINRNQKTTKSKIVCIIRFSAFTIFDVGFFIYSELELTFVKTTEVLQMPNMLF